MNVHLLPQVLQDLIGEFNVEHRQQMRIVLYEMLERHLKNKYCMNCDYYYAEIKYSKDIFHETYIFCSEWYQWGFATHYNDY